MTFRTFTDPNGVTWNAWDVRPKGADRRKGEERRSRGIDDPGVDPPVLDERTGAERRHGGGEDVKRVQVAAPLSGGWLAFESTSERRRLSPIPPRWEHAPASELARLCARASAGPTPPRRLIE